MSLSAGERLGPYELLSLIGEGGMGEVWKARDTRLGRVVALKFSKAAFSNRFEREARLVAALNHPNICTLHDIGPNYLVMELVEGLTLAERIGKGTIPLGEAIVIAKQIADALEAAHENGIIHRDLKPANVKLTAGGNVKVLDFGLAKATNDSIPPDDDTETPTASLTQPGEVMGTAAYMPPEQARGEAVDKRADIWAFGVVLYEMVTGKRPFAGKTMSDLFVAVLTKEPEWDAVPLRVRRLVRRCMEKDPKRRLRDIGDARLELDEVPETAPPPARIRLGVLPASLAVALALLAAYHWWPALPASLPLVRLNVDLGPGVVSDVGRGPTVILSPDGTRLVYLALAGSGKHQLFTRKLDQEQATPLAGTEGANMAFFSPDGQSVGFFAGKKLKTISLLGRGVVEVCDAPSQRGASWGEDGKIYVVLDFNSPISSVPAQGGEAKPVTEMNKEKGEITHRWPQVLPGAQAILFTAHTVVGNFDEATIEMQSLRTGRRKTLVTGGHFGRYASSGHLLYFRKSALYAAPLDADRMELSGPAVVVQEGVWGRVPSGAAFLDLTRTGILVYMKEKPPTETLEWLDSTGRTQPLRSGASSYVDTIRFSPDGKRLAMGTVEGVNLDLWAYEWERDKMTRLTFSPSADSFPVWVPNGKHIAFQSNVGGKTNLYWIRADGGGEVVRLTDSKNVQRPYSFTPDGKRLAFEEETAQTGSDLWTVTLEDAESDHPKTGKPEPFLQTAFNESAPMISPDGRWVAYQSDESRSTEIYVRKFPGTGGKWQISTGGGDSPVWSKNGHELFYRTREGIMAASYTVNGEAFVAGKPRLWAAKKDLGRFFDPSPDGKRFAIVQDEAPDQRSSNHVTFLQNFHDELRRRAPVERK